MNPTKNLIEAKFYMNPTKNLIDPKLYIIPTENLIEPKLYMNPTKNLIDLKHKVTLATFSGLFQGKTTNINIWLPLSIFGYPFKTLKMLL